MATTPENTQADSPEFLFIGERPALDFINTRFARHGKLTDLLGSWSDLVAWLEKAGLTPGAALDLPPTETHAALQRVHEFRQAWYEQIHRLKAHGEVSDDFLELLNSLLADDVFSGAIERRPDGYEIVRRPSALRGEKLVLALLAGQVAKFLAESDLSYLRKCANTSCVLYFYDTTKNHRRLWCSGTLCGNRHKVAAFRQRRQAQMKGQP